MPSAHTGVVAKDARTAQQRHYDRQAGHGKGGRKKALQQRAKTVTYELKLFHNSRKRDLVHVCSGGTHAVLDLACGRGGDIQKWIDAKVETVVGIDISGSEVAEARARFKEAAKKRRMLPTAFQFVQSSDLGVRVREWNGL